MALTAVFAVSAAKLLFYTLKLRAEERAFAELAELAADSAAGSGGRDGPQTAGETSGYEALKEKNGDFFGWVSIDGAGLNYPVMYTPEDPQHYLRRAFDGSASLAGVPFLDASCFTGCGNYLIYGHNMKNGSMFSALLDYAQPDYWRQHPVIRFDTLDGTGEYAVLAAFYAEPDAGDEKEAFRYYQYTDLRDEAAFWAYIGQARAAALYDTGAAVEYGGQLLTLSTCSDHAEDGRFVVIAAKTPGITPA